MPRNPRSSNPIPASPPPPPFAGEVDETGLKPGSSGEVPRTRRAAFLDALAQGHSPTVAARRARIAKTTLYRWRDRDPDFAKAWDLAIDQHGGDWYEDRLRDKAAQGDTRAIVVGLQMRGRYKDGRPGFTKKPNGTLHIIIERYQPPAQPDALGRPWAPGNAGGTPETGAGHTPTS